MEIILRQATLTGQDGRRDIKLADGRITSIEKNLSSSASKELQCEGRLVLPGFVNAHLHLDKSLVGHGSGKSIQAGRRESKQHALAKKRGFTAHEIAKRASHAIEAAILNGTTFIRGFADVDTAVGVEGIRALVDLRDRFKDLVTLQIVAFPQEGIIRDRGSEKLLEKAMDLGADVVGGKPWYEWSDSGMRQHVDFCLDLATDRGVDVHFLLDDTESPLSRSLEYVALSVIDRGFEGRVIAGHCGALASYDDDHAADVISLVKDAGISICSNPHISLVVMGRRGTSKQTRGITRVNELIRSGVNVLAAQDDMDDFFYPFGKPDQLEVAQYVAHVAQLTSHRGLHAVIGMVTHNAAEAVGLSEYGIEVQNVADLVVLDAASEREALRLIPPRRWVLRRGRVVAETKTERKVRDVNI